MEKMNYYYYYHYNYCYILLTKFETLPLPSPKAATCIQYRAFLKVLTVKCLKACWFGSQWKSNKRNAFSWIQVIIIKI